MAMPATPPTGNGSLARDLADAGEYLEMAGRAPDGVLIPLRVKGTTQEERLAELDSIARDLGVRVGVMGDGTRIAEKRIGHVRIEAHVSPQGSAHIVRRIDEARAPRGGKAA
jgi:hypothetical protein